RDRRTQAILPLKGKILNVEKARFDKMLASAEVGTLITALGCGIGREDFNPDKLRYHRIIIMTDADVDGSHIRTLLLTFFYRQMRELVDRGHIYIAQPPLYKVKKGKQEQYLKDDLALNQYLLQLAVDNAALQVNADAPLITGIALETMAREYLVAQAIIERLSHRYDAVALKAVLHLPKMTAAGVAAGDAFSGWLSRFISLINEFADAGVVYEVALSSPADEAVGIAIQRHQHGVSRETFLPASFFSTADYKVLGELAAQLEGLIGADARVLRGEKTAPITHFEQAIDWLMQEGRRGLGIQRYKGLGEMNPDQLWETTMNPATRRLLQVRIEDAIASDELFTILMGDLVEPRRDFIERFALSAVNIDI
ncbi:MAG: DNA gyrase subunit B, partial [Halothiobacillus sp. 39-53-45]